MANKRRPGDVMDQLAHKEDNESEVSETPPAPPERGTKHKERGRKAPAYGGADSLTGGTKVLLDRPIEQVRNIDPALIRVSEANARLQELLTKESIAELAESIQEHGQIEPAEVFRLPDNEQPDEGSPRYELISGSRRLQAVKSLEKPLRAIVYEPEHLDLDSAEAALELISRSRAENKSKRPTQYEYAKALARTMERFPELTQAEIGKALGLDQSSISSLNAFSKFPLEAAQALGEESLRSLKPQVGARWTRDWDTDKLVGLIKKVRENNPSAQKAQLIALIDREARPRPAAGEKRPAPKWQSLPSGARIKPDWRKGRLHFEVKLQKDLKDPDRTLKEISDEVKKLLESDR